MVFILIILVFVVVLGFERQLDFKMSNVYI